MGVVTSAQLMAVAKWFAWPAALLTRLSAAGVLIVFIL